MNDFYNQFNKSSVSIFQVKAGPDYTFVIYLCHFISVEEIVICNLHV